MGNKSISFVPHFKLGAKEVKYSPYDEQLTCDIPAIPKKI